MIPKDENELIIPAREGTLRVLQAALASGVKRVVLTSSAAAVWEGHTDYDKIYDCLLYTSDAADEVVPV